MKKLDLEDIYERFIEDRDLKAEILTIGLELNSKESQAYIDKEFEIWLDCQIVKDVFIPCSGDPDHYYEV